MKFWELPLDEMDPTRGFWGEGPGIAFFDAARKRLHGLPLIVEDLGHITPDVIELREEVGVPGMNVVARVSDIDWRTDSVLYTSTHDSDTLAGWWQRWGRDNQPQLAAGATSREGEHRALLQNVLAVENELVIIPAQDLLGLGTEARMNRPGTTDPRNWRWRLERPLTGEQAAHARLVDGGRGSRRRQRRRGRLTAQPIVVASASQIGVRVAGAKRPRGARQVVEGVALGAPRVVRQQVDRDRRLGRGRPHAVDVVGRRQEHVVVAGCKRTPARELDAALARSVELLVLIALVETDEPPRQVVVDRGHRARRHDEAEQAQRAVCRAEEEPLADASTHAAVGHVPLELGREPVALGEGLLEEGPDALARLGGASPSRRSSPAPWRRARARTACRARTRPPRAVAARGGRAGRT